MCIRDRLGTKAGLTLSPFVLHTECNDMLADTVIRANIGEGDFFRAEMENFVNAIEGIAPVSYTHLQARLGHRAARNA